ncbi:hypothetical protein J7J83_04405 [bacterium]|nr:hypothetical protein [bacterium]
MSQVVVNRNTLANRNRRRGVRTFEIKTFAMLMSVALVISFLSVMTLVNFNHISTKGYTIKYLEVQQQQLWEQNERIKKDLLENKSLSALTLSEKANRMVKPGDAIYVSKYTVLAQK